jgi:hypothetical protein
MDTFETLRPATLAERDLWLSLPEGDDLFMHPDGELSADEIPGSIIVGVDIDR